MITALIGKPVQHSISNYLFDEYANVSSIPSYYHWKIEVDREELKYAISHLIGIGCKGFNITMPYKIIMKDYVDEIDESAKKSGAVNCVTIDGNGRLYGYNTDGIGAWRAISTHLKQPTNRDSVLILGSGGAARSIILKALELNMVTYVLSRDLKERELLRFFFQEYSNLFIEELNVKNLIHWSLKVDFLINATSVGMWPELETSLISQEIWDEISRKRDLSTLHLFDAVLNPWLTKLLKNAKERNAKIASGLWMMIYQGIEAFRLWTGFDVSSSIQMDPLFDHLQRKIGCSINNSQSYMSFQNFKNLTLGALNS